MLASSKNKLNGFSLMEIMLVVSISSILMFAAIPSVKRQVLNTKVKQFTLDFNDLVCSITAHKTMYGYYPDSVTGVHYLPNDIYLFLPPKFRKEQQSSSGIPVSYIRPFSSIEASGWKYEYNSILATATLSAVGIIDQELLTAGFEAVKDSFGQYNCTLDADKIIYTFDQDI